MAMIRLLVADDEKGICDFIGDFFSRRGHKVFTVWNPSKILSTIAKEQPQIIILDLMMPQIGGLEILKEVKSKYKGIKVIIVTVSDDKATKDKAIQLGADDYITKPFSTEYLEMSVMLRIQELLNAKKQPVEK